VWDAERSVVRWMCSFDTTDRDVRQLARFVAETVKKK
jgi:threonine aldolase